MFSALEKYHKTNFITKMYTKQSKLDLFFTIAFLLQHNTDK